MKPAYKKTNKLVDFNPYLLIFFFFVGGCIAFFIYVHRLQFPLFSKRNLFITFCIAGSLTIILEIAYRRVFEPIVSRMKRNDLAKGLILALLLSIAFLSVFSIETNPFYFLYPQEDVRVQINLPEGEMQSAGLLITHIHNDFRDISFSELKIEGEFENRGDGIYFYPGQNAHIHWKAVVGSELSITLVPLAPDHAIEIDWGDGSGDIYTFSNMYVENNIRHPYPYSINEKTISRLVAFPIVFIMLLALLLNLKGSFPYASVLIFVWLLMLLVYWPGIIGDTNILVTNNFFAGTIEDWHPVMYTVILGIFIKIFSTAASFLIIQIIALGIVVGWGFSYLERKGVSKTLLWVLTFMFAFTPANLLSMITLTNDIPYSIALLTMTIFLIKVLLSDGNWLERPNHWIAFSLVALTAILFRYNGIPAVGLSILGLLIFSPQQWKNILKIGTAIIVLFVLINGPLFNVLGVRHVAEGQLDNIILHHISAHVDAGTPLSNDQEQYLDALYPLADWDYSCCSNAAMWFKDDFDSEAFHQNSSLNRKILIDLFLKNPGVELDHILCASDMVWSIPGRCEIKNPFIGKQDGAYFWTRSYFPEYTEKSKIPLLVQPVSELFLGIENNKILATLFWRPAIYLYIALVSLIVFQIRNKQPKAFLILCPLLGQSLFLFFFNRIQNFRYQYGAVIIGLFLIGLVFLPTNLHEQNESRKNGV